MKQLIQRILIVLVFLIAVGGSGATYYFYTQYQATQKLLKNPDEAAKQEVNTVIGSLGKLMELPKDEDPSVATVLDATKLKDQPFFADAVNGDKVVIYTKSAEAILYRPSANKIIKVMPISINQQEQTATPTAKVTPKPTVEPTVNPTP